MSAYREPSEAPACEVCAARDAVAATLGPFKKSDNICPHCLDRATLSWFCTGSHVLRGPGEWPWKGPVLVRCGRPKDSVPHFHFWCRSCATSWATHTAAHRAKP